MRSVMTHLPATRQDDIIKRSKDLAVELSRPGQPFERGAECRISHVEAGSIFWQASCQHRYTTHTCRNLLRLPPLPAPTASLRPSL